MKKLLLILVVLMVVTAMIASLFKIDTTFDKMVQDGFLYVETIADSVNAISEVGEKIGEFGKWVVEDYDDYADGFGDDYNSDKYNYWMNDEMAFTSLYYCFVMHRDLAGSYVLQTKANSNTLTFRGDRMFVVEGSVNGLKTSAVYLRIGEDGCLVCAYQGAPYMAGSPWAGWDLKEPGISEYAYMYMFKSIDDFDTINVNEMRDWIANEIVANQTT